MGNSCCRADSPCATAEEKSGLLSDESKAMSNSVKKTGACGPEGSDERRWEAETEEEISHTSFKNESRNSFQTFPGASGSHLLLLCYNRCHACLFLSQSPEEEASKVPVQQCPDNEDTEPNNTQENGPFQNKGLQEAAPSPSKMPENSTPAQDEETKVIPAEGDRAENLQCTLNSQQKDPPTTDAAGIVALNAEPKKEELTLVQDETPNAVVIPSLPEKATPEPTAANATVDEVSKEVIASAAKPSEESAQSDEGSSVPSCQPTAAAGGAASISAATEETAPDTLSW